MLLSVSNILKGMLLFLSVIHRKVVEVIGVVDNNCSISLHTVTAFSVASYSRILCLLFIIDAAGYNKLVEYMNGKFRQEIF